MHALRVNVGSTIGSSPGALVFGWDMFINLPLIADWHLLLRHAANNSWMTVSDVRMRNDDDLIMSGPACTQEETPANYKLGDRTEGPYYNTGSCKWYRHNSVESRNNRTL
jgi:hypothetical protein